MTTLHTLSTASNLEQLGRFFAIERELDELVADARALHTTVTESPRAAHTNTEATL